MLTQCPHCLTLFRIGPEQLKAAAGKVRCSRCNQVFNALQRLEEAPTSFHQKEPSDAKDFFQEEEDFQAESDTDNPHWETPASEGEIDWPATQPNIASTEQEGGTDDADARFEHAQGTEGLNTVSDLDIDGDSDFILEQDDGLETEPDYFAGGTESQMSELLDQDTASALLEDEEAENEAAEIIDFLRKDNVPEDVPEDREEEEEISPGYDFGDSILKDEALDLEEGKPDYDSVPAFRASVDEPSLPQPLVADEDVYDFEPASKPVKARSSASPFWIGGSIVLLLLLGSQIVWQFRDSLIQNDVGRQLVTTLCRIAGCSVPIRRDTDKIIIHSRNLSSHPDKPDVLFMQLVMVNTAAFEQPFPKVQLSLFNDKGKLIARRIFTPDEYLPQDAPGKKMMPKAQPVQVEMQLVDPGKEVTGFTFDFL